MKCVDCNEKEALTNSGFCEECKKKRDDKWHTCRFCGVKDGEEKYNFVFMSCCERCRKKNEDKSDFEEAEKEGKITREDSIMCPYCGDVQTNDIYAYNNSDTYQCPECDKESDLSIEVTYHYTTRKKV